MSQFLLVQGAVCLHTIDSIVKDFLRPLDLCVELSSGILDTLTESGLKQVETCTARVQSGITREIIRRTGRNGPTAYKLLR